MSVEWTSILLSALFAGIVATAVTVAIEKWGGLVGGLLGTVPSTIVPAGIGMYVAGGEDVLVVSMAVVPLGMLLNALFLGAWVVIPRWFPNAPYLLVLTTVGALAFWTLLGMVFLVAVDELTTYLSLQQLASPSGLCAPVHHRRGVQSSSTTHAQGDQPCLNAGLGRSGRDGGHGHRHRRGFLGPRIPDPRRSGQRVPGHFLHQHGGLVVGSRSDRASRRSRADDARRRQRGGVRQRRHVVASGLRGAGRFAHRLGWLRWLDGRCRRSWCCAITTLRSTVDGSGPTGRSGNVHHLNVNEGDAFDLLQAFAQGVKSSRQHGQCGREGLTVMFTSPSSAMSTC